jgi:putative endonuclease
MAGSTAGPTDQVKESIPAASASYVYVIGTGTPSGFKTYVGWTLDPARRLEQHNNGIGAKSTRGQHWQLLYVEKLDTRAAAMSREWHLKRNRRFRRELADRWPFPAAEPR